MRPRYSRIGKWNQEPLKDTQVYVPRFDGCCPLESDIYVVKVGIIQKIQKSLFDDYISPEDDVFVDDI